MGGYHAQALTELGSQLVVYEPNEQHAQSMAEHFAGIAIARCLEEAIEAADIVHICTPPMVHIEGALASIAQRKPTIIEKPLTHDLQEALEIHKAATAAEVPLLVGKHFRLTPPFLEIEAGVRREDIGTLNSLETTYVHDMRKLRAGTAWRKALGSNGFVYEGAAHPVDLNMWLAGQPVHSVQATLSPKKICPDYGWAEDHTYTLTYEDGTIGRVWANAATPLPQHGTSVAVYGSTGAYRAHNKRAELMTFRDGEADWVATPTAPVGQTIRPMAELFHRYLKGESETFAPMPGIEESLKVMLVLDTIERAAESGQNEKVPTLDEVLSP